VRVCVCAIECTLARVMLKRRRLESASLHPETRVSNKRSSSTQATLLKDGTKQSEKNHRHHHCCCLVTVVFSMSAAACSSYPSLYVLRSSPGNVSHLIIGFLFNPTSWISSDEEFSDLVIKPDDEGEWKRHKPPLPLEWIHTKSTVHAGTIGQERGEEGFLKQTHDEHTVLHALLEERKASCLTDEEISPLHDDDGGEESGVAGELDDFTLTV